MKGGATAAHNNCAGDSNDCTNAHAAFLAFAWRRRVTPEMQARFLQEKTPQGNREYSRYTRVCSVPELWFAGACPAACVHTSSNNQKALGVHLRLPHR